MPSYGRYGRGPGGSRGSRTTTFRYRKGAAAARSGALFAARGRGAMARGRFAGYYRRTGYYGRFNSGGELKFHDVAVDDAVIATGANVIAAGSVNLIAQGVTESTRVGRKCVIRSINWRGRLILPAASATNSAHDTVRVIMVLDKQANGATIVNTDLLEDAGTAAIAYRSFNNLANKSRFVVLYDKTFSLNATAAAGDGTTNTSFESSRMFSFYKKCSIPIEFSSTTGALTEIRSNNITVLYCSENGVAGVESTVRLRFSDG